MRLKSPRVPRRCAFNGLRAAYCRPILSPSAAIDRLLGCGRYSKGYLVIHDRSGRPMRFRVTDMTIRIEDDQLPLDERDRCSGFVGPGCKVSVVTFSSPAQDDGHLRRHDIRPSPWEPEKD
jgi:hypothetical protein